MCGIQEVSRSSERFYILIIVKILLMAIIEQYVIDKIVNITYAIILTTTTTRKLHCNVTSISVEKLHIHLFQFFHIFLQSVALQQLESLQK